MLFLSGVWLTGPIVLKSNIDTLHLEKGAVIFSLLMWTSILWWNKYLRGWITRRCQSPISGRNLENVAITGEGAIDGNGHYWRPLKREKVTESVLEARQQPVAVYINVLPTGSLILKL